MNRWRKGTRRLGVLVSAVGLSGALTACASESAPGSATDSQPLTHDAVRAAPELSVEDVLHSDTGEMLYSWQSDAAIYEITLRRDMTYSQTWGYPPDELRRTEGTWELSRPSEAQPRQFVFLTQATPPIPEDHYAAKALPIKVVPCGATSYLQLTTLFADSPLKPDWAPKDCD
jgi:hypothetical protein